MGACPGKPGWAYDAWDEEPRRAGLAPPQEREPPALGLRLGRAHQRRVPQIALDELIRRLPEGLDTVVGERGVVLSGGERQRTALARALLRRPRLLLLDDALSAVDAETESRILENLRTFLGTSTLVLATHRIFVAETCTRVLVLKEGRAMQLGTPEALADEPGPYARLRRLQSLERELVKGAG